MDKYTILNMLRELYFDGVGDSVPANLYADTAVHAEYLRLKAKGARVQKATIAQIVASCRKIGMYPQLNTLCTRAGF